VENSEECVLNASTQREMQIKQSKNQTKTTDTHNKPNNGENSEDSEQTETGRINRIELVFVLMEEVALLLTISSSYCHSTTATHDCNTRLQRNIPQRDTAPNPNA